MKQKLEALAEKYGLKDTDVYKINGFFQSRLCKRAIMRGEDIRGYLKSEILIKKAYDLTNRYLEMYRRQEK